jgi:hypothetical protein
MRKFTPLPSQDELREHFDYRDGRLFWRHNTSRRSAGDEVGVLDKKTGYRVGCLNYIRFVIHRVVWVWHHGAIPDGMVVDHIDRNKENNRVENLRLVSETLSIHNRSMKNKVPGVRPHKGGFEFREVRDGKLGPRCQFKTWFEVIHARYNYELERYGEPRKETATALLNLYVS